MKKTSRIPFIDTLKGFLILGVILIHTSISGEVVRVLLLFAISSFFFINGMLARKHFDKKPKDFFKKISKTILIPYFVIGILSYLYWLVVNSIFDLGSDTPLFKPLVGLLYGNGHNSWLIMNGPLWFLTCLFSVQTLHYFVRKVPSKKLQWFIVFFLFGLGIFNAFHPILSFRLPFGLDIAFYLLFLSYIGAEWKDKWLAPRSKNLLYGLTLIFHSPNIKSVKNSLVAV